MKVTAKKSGRGSIVEPLYILAPCWGNQHGETKVSVAKRNTGRSVITNVYTRNHGNSGKVCLTTEVVSVGEFKNLTDGNLTDPYPSFCR